MLSQTTEYALRAAVYLAESHPEPRTNRQIARQTRVSSTYLAKVLHGLARHDVVNSQRGLHGGFVLARPANEVTLLEVVNAVEPVQRIERCPLEIVQHGENLCPLHSRLDAAIALVEKAFGETTLAEILDEPTESVPLCPFPRAGKPDQS